MNYHNLQKLNVKEFIYLDFNVQSFAKLIKKFRPKNLRA